MTDSAGVPWLGRRFPNASPHSPAVAADGTKAGSTKAGSTEAGSTKAGSTEAENRAPEHRTPGHRAPDLQKAADGKSGDDGAAPPKLMDALRLFRDGKEGEEQVVDALRESRLLVPLIAELVEASTNQAGRMVDKSQGLSVVTVTSPDGRRVLPAFTSVEAMARWNPLARPVPTPAVRVALAAASEDTELVVIDPTSTTQFAVRRPALRALAEAAPWAPSYLDADVLREFMDAALDESSVYAINLAPGDPFAQLHGPELIVMLSLADGLDRAALDDLVSRLATRWRASALISARVDSMTVRPISPVNSRDQ